MTSFDNDPWDSEPNASERDETLETTEGMLSKYLQTGPLSSPLVSNISSHGMQPSQTLNQTPEM